MKQIWITKAGAPEVLEIRETEDPRPGADELLIDVKAAGVNFADVLARRGMYPDAPPIPCVVGYEAAGAVREIGAEVDGFAAGDRVFCLTRFGGYTDTLTVPATQCLRVPEGMELACAAAIPVNYFTAYLGIAFLGNAHRGERVLIHNAGGGVGIAATQIARSLGATVYGTASGWKHERLRKLGVEYPIDYRTTDFVEAVRKRTEGRGVDVIFDPIGGRNLKRDLEILAPLGRLIGFGLSEPVREGGRSILRTLRSVLGMPRPSFLKLLGHNWSIGGLNLGHLWSEMHRLRSVGDRLLAGFADGSLEPVIEAEIPFSEAPKAHRLLQERKNFGKVLLIPD